jgi:hypothetical protein
MEIYKYFKILSDRFNLKLFRSLTSYRDDIRSCFILSRRPT